MLLSVKAIFPYVVDPAAARTDGQPVVIANKTNQRAVYLYRFPAKTRKFFLNGCYGYMLC
jgi:hypothetical protein